MTMNRSKDFMDKMQEHLGYSDELRKQAIEGGEYRKKKRQKQQILLRQLREIRKMIYDEFPELINTLSEVPNLSKKKEILSMIEKKYFPRVDAILSDLHNL